MPKAAENHSIPQENPFRMPSDSGVFAMREEDKRLKLEVIFLLLMASRRLKTR